MTTSANLTCPKCNFTQKAEMPVNACQHFFKCIKCGETAPVTSNGMCKFCNTEAKKEALNLKRKFQELVL